MWEKQSDVSWRADTSDGWYEADQHIYMDGTEGFWSCYYRSKLIADQLKTIDECFGFCDSHYKEFYA